jgi:hypothetical protein
VFKPDLRVFQILSTNYRVVNVHPSSPNPPPVTMVVSRLTLWRQVLAVQAHAISAAFVMTTIAIRGNNNYEGQDGEAWPKVDYTAGIIEIIRSQIHPVHIAIRLVRRHCPVKSYLH